MADPSTEYHLGGCSWCCDPGHLYEVSQERREMRFGSGPEAEESHTGTDLRGLLKETFLGTLGSQILELERDYSDCIIQSP